MISFSDDQLQIISLRSSLYGPLRSKFTLCSTDGTLVFHGWNAIVPRMEHRVLIIFILYVL
jgi:hypothetical protein